MFYENEQQILNLVRRTGFAIFVTSPSPLGVFPKNSTITISPDSKGKITIDQIREILELCKMKQASDFFIVIDGAENMNEQAQNAFLKALEEPLANYHFVLFTANSSALLPTVLSRGEIYVKKPVDPLSTPVDCPPEVKNFAKQLISASSKDLPGVMNSITTSSIYKKKDNARPFTLSIVAAAIEILYKSYFETKNPKFLIKIPKLLQLYDNLKQNGHIKLHLVADLC